MKKFPIKLGALYFGPVPDRQELDVLKEHSVEVIWNLGEELDEEFEEERDLFPTAIHTPIKDYDIPGDKFTSDIQTIKDLLKAGQTCYVHCLAGHGRTGMALACLAVLDGNKVEQALKLAKQYCSGPEREVQVNFVRQWARQWA